MKILYVDGTGGFSPHRLAEKPCGGIITSLTLIPQYLAKRGLDVTVASEFASSERINGVRYIDTITEEDKASDVVVFNRNIYNHAFLDMFPKSYKVWWLHDIVDHRYMEDDSYHRMDKVVSLSDYCTDSYSEFFEIEKGKFTKITNGVDKSVFYPPMLPATRRQDLFVTASASIKGLYPLWFTFVNLKRVMPSAELRVYSSQSLHDKEDSPAVKAQLKQLADEGAKILDPIPQHELADVFRQANVVLFPSHYPEICSNLVLQALECGAKVVSSNIGSAHEFVPGFGLTKRRPHDMFLWWKDFAVRALAVSQTKYEARFYTPSWDDIGNQWFKLLTERN